MVGNFYFRALTFSLLFVSAGAISACSSSGSSSHRSKSSSTGTSINSSTDTTDNSSTDTTDNSSTNTTDSSSTDTTDSSSTDTSAGTPIMGFVSRISNPESGTTSISGKESYSANLKVTDGPFTKVSKADLLAIDYRFPNDLPDDSVIWQNTSKLTITKSDGTVVTVPSEHFIATNGCNPAASDCIPLKYIKDGEENERYAEFNKDVFNENIAMQGEKTLASSSDVVADGGVITINAKYVSSRGEDVSLANSDFGIYEDKSETITAQQAINGEEPIVRKSDSYGYYSVSNATTIAKMDELKSNNVKATYEGQYEATYLSRNVNDNTTKTADAGGNITLNADFGEGTITGKTDELKLDFPDNGGGTFASGMAVNIQGTIDGNTYSGGSSFVDVSGNAIGSNVSGVSQGAFAGTNAEETVGAFSTVGTIDNEERIVNGSFGATTSGATPTN